MVKEIVDKITPHIKGIGAIFGSYAKEIEKKEAEERK